MLVVRRGERPDGEWNRRAEYPELPGYVVEADSPLEAIEKLEAARVQYILGRLERGEPVPVPRPPLQDRAPSLDRERLGFAKWLVEQRRFTEDT